MKWYPWLDQHFKKLITNYRIGYVHRALLIQVLPGMGDDALVYAIARFLMCQELEGQKSCGKCRGCQLMQAKTHPDYYVLEAEEDKSTLGIEVVRGVSEKIYQHSRLGGFKIIWLKDALQLTEIASNALLKILEELAEKAVFFLSCRSPGKLLATLRSRCCLYHLNVPDETWAMDWLSREIETSPEERLSALRLCSGAPAAALAQLQPEVWSERERFCCAFYDTLKSGDWLSLLEVLNHEDFVRRLDWMASLLLDAMKLRQGIVLLDNLDVRPLLNLLANSFSGGSNIQNIFYDVCRTRSQLSGIAGLNRELLLVNFLLCIEDYFLQSRI